MKTIVIEATPCPSCGKPMPAGALAGLCPACLLAQGAETDAGEGQRGARFEPPPIDDIKKLFPQLEILGLLGAGGMGAVYKARQPALDRFVALKVLPASNKDGINFAERFNREARALARLSHPNIVAVHEFGQADALHFFIMEFVDGTNLRQLERAGRLAPREALQIIPQICDALQYAHDEGVVHRDIKPENVLVDRKGRVKIADFGLAKILGVDAEALRLTVEGQVMGTPHYMAPEQIERPLTVDHRADIYSLGVVLYEMLTGDLPLGKFSPPSRKVEVDVRLDDVVLRALENDPARRYQKASEVKSQVETIVGTPGQAPVSTPSPQRVVRWGGFPLVVEHDGARKVNRKEAIRAWAIIFGLLTIGFAFLSAVTGRTFMGWLGISGMASLLVRLFIGGLLVAAGVKRSLQRPWDEEFERTSTGTVILQRKTPWWRSRRVVALSLILLAATWTAAHLREVSDAILKRTQRAKIPATQVAKFDPASGALVVRLPKGGEVELLAISDEAAPANAWWRPDGTAIPDTLFETEGIGRSGLAGIKVRDIIVFSRDLPKGASGPIIQIDPAPSTFSSGRKVWRDGQELNGGEVARAGFPSTARTATLRVGYGLDAWTTISTHGRNSSSTTYTSLPGVPQLRVGIHQLTENNGAAAVTILMEPNPENWNVRLVGTDVNGTENVGVSSAGSSLGKSTIWTYTFAHMPLAQLKEFRVQMRPIHWIEFRDVALEPEDRALVGKSSRTFKPTAFSEVKEVHITELFDFDTGNLSSVPSELRAMTPGLVLRSATVREQGVDAAAGINELRLAEMEITDLAPSEWDRLKASEMTERLNRSFYGPSRLPSTREAGIRLPLAYAFRTREKTIGMFELVSFDEGQAGVTLRYKTVERAHFE